MEVQGNLSGSQQRGRGYSSLRKDVTNSVLETVETISQTINFEEIAEKIKLIVHEHPFLSTFVIVSISTCLIPILAFLMFTFITLFISLSILLFIEGTIIACAGFILLFVLGGCLTFSFGLTLSLFTTYKIITSILDLLQYSKPRKSKSYPPPSIPVSNLSPSTEGDAKDMGKDQEKKDEKGLEL